MKKVRAILAATLAAMVLAIGGTSFAAASDVSAKLKSLGQKMKCDLRYSVEVLKCKTDSACKERVRQERQSCKESAQ